MDQTGEQTVGEPQRPAGRAVAPGGATPPVGPVAPGGATPPVGPVAFGGATQPVGRAVAFGGATPPVHTELRGRHVLLRPIDPAGDAPGLYAASHPPDGDPGVWTYLYDGPYPDLESFRTSLEEQAARHDYVFFTVASATDNRPLGIVSYLSIVPEHGVIEIGNIWFSPELQRTAAATETIFLLARHAFDELGYRRLEWKCHSINEPSRRAAARFGFHFEGVFLNHRVVKGRNRDTAWFAITEERWPAVRSAFEQWLRPENFDAGGAQRSHLSELTADT